MKIAILAVVFAVAAAQSYSEPAYKAPESQLRLGRQRRHFLQ
ncbi:Uncharacterized protein APZ42_023146 [Daphnia magna]|uniref:Uncharacterized protein n=1 Tax=Daphnia magna TaxID=35525 RepID=A0A164V797_9CRUS|nr:Uncharacterized protein APZ42_023146 [Daphnia magna]